jgi:hypothetical protein
METIITRIGVQRKSISRALVGLGLRTISDRELHRITNYKDVHGCTVVLLSILLVE